MINYRPDPSEGNWHISYLKAPTSSKNVFSTITLHTGASRVSKETNEHLSVLFCDCVCIVFLRRKPLLFSWGKRSGPSMVHSTLPQHGSITMITAGDLQIGSRTKLGRAYILPKNPKCPVSSCKNKNMTLCDKHLKPRKFHFQHGGSVQNQTVLRGRDLKPGNLTS